VAFLVSAALDTREEGMKRARSAVAAIAAVSLVGVAAVAHAQTVTFSNIVDSAPGNGWDPARTAPDPEDPNRLVFAFHSGISPTTWVSLDFRASTASFSRRSATDTMCMLVSAEEGYYVSALTYVQGGGGSISRVAGASGVTTFVVNNAPAPGQGFSTNPSFTRRVDLTGQGLTSVPFCVTTSLFVWAAATSGAATVSVGASVVAAELLPVP
jgi:hypothetical protein